MEFKDFSAEVRATKTKVAKDMEARVTFAPEGRKKWAYVYDSYTYTGEDGYDHVMPIAVYDLMYNSITIVCPVCHKFHSHSDAPGHRCSHCYVDNPDYKGYVIDSYDKHDYIFDPSIVARTKRKAVENGREEERI